MGKYYQELTPDLISWIKEQHCFWVASAPLSPEGHVNVSPKGTQDGRVFHIVDERSCYYLDLTGSGVETISHIYENSRLTICFTAFTGPPQIVRLWGRGRVLERGTPAYDALIPFGGDRERELDFPGLRAIIWLDIEQVGTSCGFSVPYYDFREFRYTLDKFSETKDRKHKRTGKFEDGNEWYWAYKNTRSVDGLPGLKRGVEAAKREGMEVAPMEKFVGLKEAYRGSDGTGVRKSWMERPITLLFLGFVLGVLAALLMQYSDQLLIHRTRMLARAA